MQPIAFPTQTIELQPNPNQLEIDGQKVGALPIFTDGDQCVSKWRLTFGERLKVFWYGHIWLGIHSGRTQPPVWLSADKEKFSNNLDN